MNNCRTCKWAEWQMTKHAKPRVALRGFGRCLYPLTRVAIPAALKIAQGEIDKRMADKPLIWPLNPQINCRVWEKAQIDR